MRLRSVVTIFLRHIKKSSIYSVKKSSIYSVKKSRFFNVDYPLPVPPKVCRIIDRRVIALATNGVLNSNVELSGRNGWKLFRHGLTEYIVKKRRIDGSWYMPMIRQLHVILVDPFVTILPDNMKRQVASACNRIYKVHAALRLPLPKTELTAYQDNVNACLEEIVGSFKIPVFNFTFTDA
jgi:hypothetical protein